jgi:hypothetical protein
MVKRLVVLASTLMSVVFLVPSVSATNSNQISIPFTNGKASIAEIAASVTKTTSGSTVGIPFTLTILDPAKLSSKIHIAAIGGLNGVSGGPGNMVLTYQIFVAIDATGLGASSTASAKSSLAFNLEGAKFHTVNSGNYERDASCNFVGDANKSLIKMKIANQWRPSFGDFGAALKKVCASQHK